MLGGGLVNVMLSIFDKINESQLHPDQIYIACAWPVYEPKTSDIKISIFFM